MLWSCNHLFVKKPGLCQAVHLFLWIWRVIIEEKVGFLPAQCRCRCRCFGLSQHNLDLFKPLHVTSAHMIHKITYKHPAASVNYSCPRLLLILFLSSFRFICLSFVTSTSPHIYIHLTNTLSIWPIGWLAKQQGKAKHTCFQSQMAQFWLYCLIKLVCLKVDFFFLFLQSNLKKKSDLKAYSVSITTLS